MITPALLDTGGNQHHSVAVASSPSPQTRLTDQHRPRHIRHVEGLRAIAAMVVYVNHAYAQAFLNATATAPQGLLSLLDYSMVAGHLAVTVFIVISGFCLTLPVVAAGDQLRGGTWEFFKRRARRILPAYYGSVALALALIWTVIGEPTGTLWDVPILVTPSAILSHLFLVQDFFATSRINYVLWSIAVEWHIYFLFPVLVWMWRRFGAGKTIAATLLITYALHFSFETTRLVRGHPHFLGMFTFGMFAAYVSVSHREQYARLRQRSAPWVLAAIASAAIAAGLTVSWGVAQSVHRFEFLDFPVGIMTASLLVLSTRTPTNALARVFSWKPLVMIGTFSYSVYLLHAPLLQLLWQYVLQPAGFGERATFAWLLTAGLGVVLLASYGFYRVFEAPFMSAPTRVRPTEAPVVGRLALPESAPSGRSA